MAQGKYKMNLEHLVPDSKEELKVQWGHMKGQGRQLEVALTSQKEEDLSIKINCNSIEM